MCSEISIQNVIIRKGKMGILGMPINISQTGLKFPAQSRRVRNKITHCGTSDFSQSENSIDHTHTHAYTYVHPSPIKPDTS